MLHSKEKKHPTQTDSPSNRIIIVSNRLPFTIAKKDNGYQLTPSSGGLASSLSSYIKSLKSKNYLWIGWTGSETDKKEMPDIRQKLSEEQNFIAINLPKTSIKNFYQGFCNSTIWPLFHNFIPYAEFKDKYWQSYKQVNKKFCQEILKVATADDLILIQDYHLMLLPKLLKEINPNLKVGFFLHTPFPSLDVFQNLPGQWRTEILYGLLGADLVGFHTTDYTQNFLRVIQRTLGLPLNLGKVQIDTFPIGINFDKFFQASLKQNAVLQEQEWKKLTGTEKVILSIDRLDYTKGISTRIQGYEKFLKDNPESYQKISLVLVVIPSREDLKQYKAIKKQIEKQVHKINSKFGTKNWQPIHYFYQSLPFEKLIGLYKVSDIALVTPIRDGMNLIAKEYIASRNDKSGVLILSELAGSANEMPETIVINPNSAEEIARAITQAINTPRSQQIGINTTLQNRLQENNVIKWANNFINSLILTHIQKKQRLIQKLDNKSSLQILKHYTKAQKRLILLDYDGTLAPFVKNPQLAKPDKTLLLILSKLASTPNTKVIVISGRDKDTLEKWLGNFPVGLTAEHGSFIKDQGSYWKMLKPLKKNWKQQIRPIMERYVQNISGSFIEEKDYSIAWHYRGSDPLAAKKYTLELLEYLNQLTATSYLQVLDGDKVLEVKNRGVDKGDAALYFINKDQYDFILAIGDDVTDEDMFKNIPFYSYSIKVGSGESAAKFCVKNCKEVINLITNLTKTNIEKSQKETLSTKTSILKLVHS